MRKYISAAEKEKLSAAKERIEAGRLSWVEEFMKKSFPESWNRYIGAKSYKLHKAIYNSIGLDPEFDEFKKKKMEELEEEEKEAKIAFEEEFEAWAIGEGIEIEGVSP